LLITSWPGLCRNTRYSLLHCLQSQFLAIGLYATLFYP
jgi:hypothetical protein